MILITINKINKMKNIKYIITFLSLALLISACEDENYEFGDIIAPANFQITTELVGADTDNPFGDGSGTVNFTVSANDAITYRLATSGSEIMAPLGAKSINFFSQDGPIGTFSVSKHIVSVIAYGKGGVSSSTSVEVEVLAPNVPPPVIIENFEGPLLPELGTFGPDGSYIAIIGNPDMSGINTSASVVEYIKPDASEGWAGLYFNNKSLEMDLYGKIALKVKSPKGGIKMLFKLENVDNTKSYEIEGSIKGGDVWEEITFDYSDAPEAEYTKIVLFFDIWNVGDDSTYYFDDVTLFN